jgi:carboxypeptidase family protein
MRRDAIRTFLFMFGLCGLLLCRSISAQTGSASVSGRVFDPNNAVILDATVSATNIDMGVRKTVSTNDQGIYHFAALEPGNYEISVAKQGFATVEKPGITVHVADTLSLNFTLKVGSVNETITVDAGAPLINSTDGSISTVVDRHFVENTPLNGRSFQGLIMLTPGVVTNSPQSMSAIGTSGEFSVNGQRTEENNYMVDGVSANLGVAAGDVGAGASGSLPASTALGTTQGLLSLDSMEEFRINSSSYSAEYGRTPGGQFSFVTRSGANRWTGTLFNYFRNDFFDANDWFNDFMHQPQSPLRQNDFGGTLGGPIAKDRLFFFLSYEGLRLVQPQPSIPNYVPTEALRTNAPLALQPVLSSFPLPHCPQPPGGCLTDLGNGLGEFVGAWSNPSSVDSYSIRIDHAATQSLRYFFRFSDTSSDAVLRGIEQPAQLTSQAFTTRTYTFGANSLFNHAFSNEIRLNWSSNDSTQDNSLDNFAGAQSANLFRLQGLSTAQYAPSITVSLFFGSYFPQVTQSTSIGSHRQWNLVDTASYSVHAHEIKLGLDFRRLTSRIFPNTPSINYQYFDQSSILANSVDSGFAQARTPAFPLYKNLSFFGEDKWRVSSRLNLDLGLRWDINPAPGASDGRLPYTLEGNSVNTWILAPQDTSLWQTTHHNFAPRVGAAYAFRNASRYETVLRGGAGIFYDTGQQLGSSGYAGIGFSGLTTFGTFAGSPATFPLPASQAVPVISPPMTPYSGPIYAFPRHLQSPFTWQWSATVEQQLGSKQAFRVSYIGAAARKLLEEHQIFPLTNSNFGPGGIVILVQNGLTSDYNALQAQFQRKLSNGLQILSSYTWSHSIDYNSQNPNLPYIRGNSDFDVRHNVSSAFSYDVPVGFHNRLAQVLLQHWGFDNRFAVRTAFPVTLTGAPNIDPATGNRYFTGLNVVPGEPLYVSGSQYPGGRSINPAAFSLAPGCTDPFTCPPGAVGDAPRNGVRGFGAWQLDFAVRRQFPIHERLTLQFRAEVFNVFNHPNFGYINSSYCSPYPTSPAYSPACTFGQATASLAQSLGVLSPLYQLGGPRSMQFALKLAF